MEALCTLYIEDCAHLELVPVALQEMAQLSGLRIRRCPKLRMLSGAGDKLLPSSLEQLNMVECGDVPLPLIGSLRRLTNLSSLVLSCSRLESLPSADVFKSLKSLEWLSIEGCENLSSLGGLGSLRYLERLIIFDCNKLTEGGSSLAQDASGGEEYLAEPANSLQIGFLQIDLPSLLFVELLDSLCHTKRLVIHEGSGLENLPERWLLQNSQSLQSLSILEVMSLESLPPNMRDLSSLDELELSDAGQLQSLPDLPSSLQKLYISRCNSELEKKIRKHGSPEWNKISHIPLVMIGNSHFIMGKISRKETFNYLRNSDQNTLTSWLNQQKDNRKLHWWNK